MEHARVLQTFVALADPTRYRIVDSLLEGEQVVGELAKKLDVAQPSVSKHLKALQSAGLVDVRQDAQRRWYRLRPERWVELDHWMQRYRRLWADRLDALERHLDAMEETS